MQVSIDIEINCNINDLASLGWIANPGHLDGIPLSLPQCGDRFYYSLKCHIVSIFKQCGPPAANLHSGNKFDFAKIHHGTNAKVLLPGSHVLNMNVLLSLFQSEDMTMKVEFWGTDRLINGQIS